jgi:hypothetical protein
MSPGLIEPSTVFILIPLIAIPIAAFMFASGAGKAFDEIGKGPLAMDHDLPDAGPAPVSKAIREAEIRQLLEAKAYRAEARGEEAIDVDRELAALLEAERTPDLGSDEGLRSEVRDLVIARNERRERAGKKALDVEKEIDRQLADLEDLGQ